MTTYRKLGYIKLDSMARRARHEFWRDCYRARWRRRLIESVLICFLLAFLGFAFVYLAFTPRVP